MEHLAVGHLVLVEDSQAQHLAESAVAVAELEAAALVEGEVLCRSPPSTYSNGQSEDG